MNCNNLTLFKLFAFHWNHFKFGRPGLFSLSVGRLDAELVERNSREAFSNGRLRPTICTVPPESGAQKEPAYEIRQTTIFTIKMHGRKANSLYALASRRISSFFPESSYKACDSNAACIDPDDRSLEILKFLKTGFRIDLKFRTWPDAREAPRTARKMSAIKWKRFTIWYSRLGLYRYA